MKPLEIPYNFDKNLIDILKILDSTINNIYCIYVQPFPEDYTACKSNYIHNAGHGIVDMTKRNKLSRLDYESHINYINMNFPNKLMLLLQQNSGLIKNLNYYYNLGFRKFCVGSIEQAKVIKNKYYDVEIVGSITMKLSLNDFLNSDELKDYFDNFILFFPFNRDLASIKKLPSDFNYTMLVNCACNIYCDGTTHWFADRKLSLHGVPTCPQNNNELNIIENSIVISPVDLIIFEPYINYFKLQGREYNTYEIIRDYILYSYDFSNKIFLKNSNLFYQQINANDQIQRMKNIKYEY